MDDAMPRKLPKYVVEDIDRHDNARYYFRRKDRPKVRLNGTPWSPQFMAEYAAALDGTGDKPQRGLPKAPTGTWQWLCHQYMSSGSFRILDTSTRSARKRILEATWDQPIAPNSKLLFGAMPLAKFGVRAISILRDRKTETPAAADAIVKAARAVFAWAVDADIGVRVDPAKDVKLFNRATEGHHTWTVDEVRQFEARHPIGTKPRLAMALMLYTGARRSDVVRLGRQMVRNGWIKFTARKGRAKKPSVIEIPLLPELAAVIEASETGDLTYLTAKAGRNYSVTGFGNRFREWCDEAGLRHCSAHGLRKAGATIAAENGATTKQLMAIYGWVEPDQAEIYTRAAERKRMAGAGMGLIDLG